MSDDRETVPVTVMVPTYRRKQYLEKALRSVAAQVHVRPAEVLVVDDGSEDGTAELARSLGARVVQKPRNEGLAAARDDALRAAEGAEWLACLDDDDQWLPHHLSTVWSKREGHVMVGGTSVSFGADAPRAHGATTAEDEVISTPARLLFPENSFTTSAVLVRRDVLMAAGGFDRSLRYLEDIDAWLRVLEHGTGLLLADVTCLYRHHSGQMSNARGPMLEAERTLLDKYRDRSWLTDRVVTGNRAVARWDDFQAARRAGRWREAAGAAAWVAARPERWQLVAELWRFRRSVRQRVVPQSVLVRARVLSADA